MNINIPDEAMDHFWEEPPAGSMEFWSFRFPPPCKVGDELIFRHKKEAIAKGVVWRIERPGQSSCEKTGKFRRGWKVFWRPESFEDLRPPAVLERFKSSQYARRLDCYVNGHQPAPAEAGVGNVCMRCGEELKEAK